jgi:TonB-dependent SusC/RagA subfamily outer membrane receptor
VTASAVLDRALSGKFAGVVVAQNSGNPGGGVSVRLRGVSTILGSADPLYIVDGVVVNNDSPSLVYLGGYTQNRLVDVNPDDIDRIEVVKGAAAAALFGSRANNGVVQIFTKRGTTGAPRFTLTQRLNADHIRKTLEVNTHPFDANGNPVTRYDWQEYIFRQAYGSETSLQMSGGTATTRYFASGAFLDNEGIVRGSSFDRVNGRLRIDQTVNNWLSVSLGGAYNASHNDDVPNGGLGALYGAIDGFLFGPNTFDPRPVNGVYPHLGAFANPVEVSDLYDFKQKTNRFIADAHVTLTPVAGLTIEYILGHDGYTQTAMAFIPRGVGTPGIYRLGWAQRATREFSQLNNDLTVRYQTTLPRTIGSTTVLGGTVQQETWSTVSNTGYDMSPVSQVVSAGATRSVSESRNKTVVEGFFGQQSFDILGRLSLTAAGRFDASSVFGVQNRWQFYPKFSGSWQVSKEPVWSEGFLGRVFPEFKVRAAWGQSGGLTAIGPYDRFTNYGAVTYGGLPGLAPSTQQGSEIKPERQTGTEVGADFSLFSSRTGLQLTYYKQHTEDLLLTASIAPSTGYSTQLQNVGAIDNHGIEVEFRTTPVSNEMLSWTSTLTYSRNRNKVSGIPGGVRVLSGSWGLAAAIEGKPLGVYYANGYRRDSEGRILATDGNPYTDKKTQIPARTSSPFVFGDPNPDWTGSWTNELSIGHNLTLRGQLDAVVGGDIWNYDARIGGYPPYGTLANYMPELKGEVAKGTGAALWSNFEAWLEDGTFVKVREVSASDALPSGLLGLQGLRVTLAGRNLHSFDNYTGYDPETNAAGQSTGVRGYQFGEVPIPRSVSLSVTVNF